LQQLFGSLQHQNLDACNSNIWQLALAVSQPAAAVFGNLQQLNLAA
jgi:hypothetical protein